ncbi:hypothetical protein C0995_009312 [Termitomyces sp. Mi166|nr:hypothetical protein C0995_009312 [Termitomyces sp. Mi166\
MLFFASLLLFSALASRAQNAFNITVNNVNLTTTQALNVPSNSLTASRSDGLQCITTTDCLAANSTIKACNDDPGCLCNATIVAYLRNCEQCMFTKLVETNQKMDIIVGSQAVLSGYATACTNTKNITFAANQTALTLPSTWDGPFVAVLPTGGVVVAVGSAAVLGISALFILSNL